MFGTLRVSQHVSIHMDHHQGTIRLLHIYYTIHIRSCNSFVAKLSQNCIVCVKCMSLQVPKSVLCPQPQSNLDTHRIEG